MPALVLLKLSLRYDNDHNDDEVVVIITAGGRQRGEEATRGKGAAQTTEMTMTEMMMTDMTMTTRQSQQG
jgi:hypothetical protein